MVACLALLNDIDGVWEEIGWATEDGCTLPPIDYPPTVTITEPSEGETVVGNVTVTATAADDDSVMQVEFFVDGESIGLDKTVVDGWSFDWDTDTTNYADGSHIVSAVATDTADLTGSDSVNVTVDNEPDPSIDSVHIGDLEGTSTTINRNKWTATVTILVQDNNGGAVTNATVSGTWSTGVSGSGITEDGLCSVSLANIRTTTPSVTFTVGDVISDGLAYDSESNSDPDGDSDGTKITIDKP